MVKSSDNRGKHKTEEAKARTHCAKGHEYTPGNTYINPKGARICRKCKNDRQKVRRREKDRENFIKYTEMLKK
jgi:hypothetical protein